MTEIVVEPFRGVGFAPLLARLHEPCFSEPWTERAFGELLALPSVAGAVARPEDPLGFILWQAVTDEAEVLTFAVLPAARRGGVGQALMLHAIDVLNQVGVGRLFLEVAENNVAAMNLYRSVGFRSVGIRRDYYRVGGMTADAVVMDLQIRNH